MFARTALCAGLLLVAACAGGRGAQVGHPTLLIPLQSTPYDITRQLETFLRELEAGPVVALGKKIDESSSDKDWESLEPWERQLWLDYAARGHGQVDSKRTNFHVTREDRLLMGLHLSLEHVGPGVREEGQRLVRDPLFVGGLATGVGLYLLLWLNPEPVFSKGIASIITSALLLSLTVQEIWELAWAWNTLEMETSHARTIAELDRAGAKFGRTMGAGGLHILMLIASKLAGKVMGSSPIPAGGSGPPVAAATVSGGLVLAEGQAIWILQGGAIALAGPGAISVAMSAGGGVDLQAHEDRGAMPSNGMLERPKRNCALEWPRNQTSTGSRPFFRGQRPRPPFQVCFAPEKTQ